MCHYFLSDIEFIINEIIDLAFHKALKNEENDLLETEGNKNLTMEENEGALLELLSQHVSVAESSQQFQDIVLGDIMVTEDNFMIQVDSAQKSTCKNYSDADFVAPSPESTGKYDVGDSDFNPADYNEDYDELPGKFYMKI